ncbi:MAG: hypothetical protein QXQ53_04985, partial [Candidatus Methanosuratincola sp.]
QVLKWDGSQWSPDTDLRDEFWQRGLFGDIYYLDWVGIGTTAPAARLSLGGGDANTKLALWQGTGAGDLMGFGIGPDQFRLHLHHSGNRFSFLNAPNGSELLTILGSGNVGIGTSNPAARLHVETGTGSAGIRVVHTAASGHVDGVKGIINTSTTGAAVSGEATATSGQTFGVYGQSNSTSGAGVVGYAAATSGQTFGMFGQSNSTSGAGVAGFATATSGISGGVYGEAHSSDGRGVVGYAAATSGFTYGVLGRSDSTSGYGVFGVKPAGGSGYGVYYLNGLAGTGTKSFQIDHPLSPETHYLNHFCTEGPEPYNAYSGNVVTDAKGYATVQLPDYFDSINRDFRYQLTVVGQFAQAIVAEEIQNNRFTIRTDKPHVKVSWRVEAVRNDRWVQRYGFQTEQEKEDEIKGKYLNPELFGMPKEYGIHYRPDVERERIAPPAPVEVRAERAKSKLRAQGAKSK